MQDRHTVAVAQFILQGMFIIALIIMFFLPFNNMNIAMLIVFVAMILNGGSIGHYLSNNTEY